MEKKQGQDKVLLDNVQYFSEVARLLAEGHSVTIPAKGRSMLPFIIGGRDSLVLVAAGSLCVGDIVLARLPERGYVLHRVYRLSGDSLTLMGDGNLRAVERCRVGDVVGKAVAILRDGHRRVDCASSAERRKARLWRHLLPLRRYLLWAAVRLGFLEADL